MSYNNPTPVVVACLRVFNEQGFIRLLAIERGLHPIGGLALPGGFVDEGETAEIAIAREIEEETRFVTKPQHWRPLTTAITPRNQLLIFMRYILTLDQPINLAFTPTNEALGFKLVDAGDTLCFPLHQEMLQRKILWE